MFGGKTRKRGWSGCLAAVALLWVGLARPGLASSESLKTPGTWLSLANKSWLHQPPSSQRAGWLLGRFPLTSPRVASLGRPVLQRQQGCLRAEHSLTAPCKRQPEPHEKELKRAVKLYKKGDILLAIEALERARKKKSSPPLVRYYLARAYLRMGRQYGKKGDVKQQRIYYQRALEEDPQLIDDPRFVARYKKLQTTSGTQKPLPIPRKPRKKRVVNLGAGLSAGIEGLGGIQLSVLLWGLLNPVVTFAPGSPSLNFSFRVIPLRQFAWSPYVGGGITLPIQSWTGALSSIFPEPLLHFDIGVHFIMELGFSFTAGVSFVYNFDPQSSLPFLPLPSVNLHWYF